MPINRTIKGDLVKLAQAGEFSVIVHGCNCFCAMGSGIAPQIAKAFPLAEEEDNGTAKGDVGKLGTYSVAYIVETGLYVINAYTQFTFTGRKHGKVDLDYNALREAFETMNSDIPEAVEFLDVVDPELQLGKKPIGIPMIGAGLAGGDWNLISKIINKATPDLDITLVEYQPDDTK